MGAFKTCHFSPHRATIEEVEGDVCELESKLDKVSPGSCSIPHGPSGATGTFSDDKTLFTAIKKKIFTFIHVNV